MFFLCESLVVNFVLFHLGMLRLGASVCTSSESLLIYPT